MHKRLLPITAALGLAATLALSGCSLGGDSADAKLDPDKSPLSEYWEAMYGGYNEKEAIAQQKKVEELVSQCMTEEGFDYTPVDQSQYSGFSPDDEDRDTEKWVAENGYGMNLSPEAEQEMNEQATEFVDPNQSYVEALSPSEQEAYYKVLYGPGPTDEEMAAMQDGDGDGYEYNWETAGCQGSAQHEINGDDLTQSDKYKSLVESMNSIWEKQQKDPAVLKVEAEWAACMADAGYSDFKVKQDAMDEASAASNAYWETATEDADAATKAEWRANEIEIALADFKCAKKVDYQKVSLTAQFRLENQFIDDNKSELDAMVADIAQAKKGK